MFQKTMLQRQLSDPGVQRRQVRISVRRMAQVIKNLNRSFRQLPLPVGYRVRVGPYGCASSTNVLSLVSAAGAIGALNSGVCFRLVLLVMPSLLLGLLPQPFDGT